MMNRLLLVVGVVVYAGYCGFAYLSRRKPAYQLIYKSGLVEHYRLTNGLGVVLVPDQSKDQMTFSISYHAPDDRSIQDQTTSHLVEHLMFRSSKSIVNLREQLRSRSIYYNAETIEDGNTYTTILPPNEDSIAFITSFEAERMQNLLFMPQDLELEKKIVKAEILKEESKESKAMVLKLLHRLFDEHAYGGLTVGRTEQADIATASQVETYYRKTYRPENADIVVTGRFDGQLVLDYTIANIGFESAEINPLKQSQMPQVPLPLGLTRFGTGGFAPGNEPGVSISSINDRGVERPGLKPTSDIGNNLVEVVLGGGILRFDHQYELSGKKTYYAAINFAPKAQDMDFALAEVSQQYILAALNQRYGLDHFKGDVRGLRDIGYRFIYGECLAPGCDDHMIASTIGGIPESPLSQKALINIKAELKSKFDKAIKDPSILNQKLSRGLLRGDPFLIFRHYQIAQRTSLSDIAFYLKGRTFDYNSGSGILDLRPFFDRSSHLVAKPEADKMTLSNGLKIEIGPTARSRSSQFMALIRLDRSVVKGRHHMAHRYLAEWISYVVRSKGICQITAKPFSPSRPNQLEFHLALTGSSSFDAVKCINQALNGDILTEENLSAFVHKKIDLIEAAQRNPFKLTVRQLLSLAYPYAPSDGRYVPSFDEEVLILNRINIADFHAILAAIDLKNSKIEIQSSEPTEEWAYSIKELETLTGNGQYLRISFDFVKQNPQRLFLNSKSNRSATYALQRNFHTSLTDDPRIIAFAGFVLGRHLNEILRNKLGLSYSVVGEASVAEEGNLGNFYLLMLSQSGAIAELRQVVEQELVKLRTVGIDAKTLQKYIGSYKNTARNWTAKNQNFESAINEGVVNSRISMLLSADELSYVTSTSKDEIYELMRDIPRSKKQPISSSTAP